VYGLGVLKGMWLTLRTFTKTYATKSLPNTYQWPEEQSYISPRIRGYDFVWWEDRCTGCATCAKSCPHGVIEVITRPAPDATYIVEEFRVDIGICMFCGLCVESCPYDALRYTNDIAVAYYERNKMVKGKHELETSTDRSSAYGRPFYEQELRRQGRIRLPKWVEVALEEEARETARATRTQGGPAPRGGIEPS
jgi:formate hydrogenlyase subunit 6/NADH:ubiquinone oxidoreductase subunit I